MIITYLVLLCCMYCISRYLVGVPSPFFMMIITYLVLILYLMYHYKFSLGNPQRPPTPQAPLCPPSQKSMLVFLHRSPPRNCPAVSVTSIWENLITSRGWAVLCSGQAVKIPSGTCIGVALGRCPKGQLATISVASISVIITKLSLNSTLLKLRLI